MTTEPTGHESTSQEGGRSKWMDDAETAIAEVRSALQAAWEESRDARGSALEAAKVAAKQLGEAIDQGIGAAKQRWEASRGDEESTSTTSTQPGEPTPSTTTPATTPVTPATPQPRPDDPTPQTSSPTTPVTTPTDPAPPAPDTSSPDQAPNA